MFSKNPIFICGSSVGNAITGPYYVLSNKTEPASCDTKNVDVGSALILLETEEAFLCFMDIVDISSK